MRKYLKLLLLAVLCLSLLAVVGCKKETPAATTTTGTTTVPQETTEGTVPEETTTEKPVNIVEDPLNNGEGDPTDAMDTTDPNKEDKPNIDIEVDDDADSNTGNGSNGNTGNGNTGAAADVYGPLKSETDYNIRISGKDLFFTGAAANGVFNTGAKTAAVKLQIEKVEGKGIKIFFMKNNVKTYLEIKAGGACALSTTGSVFTYDASGVYAVAVGGTNYYLAVSDAGDTIVASVVGNGATAAEFTNAITGDTESDNGGDDFVIDFDDLT